MATYTSRLNATKPASSENVSITTLNDNFDLFDAGVGTTVASAASKPASAFSGRIWYESDTGYLKVNTAASASTAASWVNPFQHLSASTYNVRWFNATGNGSSDDSTYVQAAFTAASAGGRVYFPPGTYVCEDLNIIGSNITVDGDGPSSIIKQKLNASDNHYLLSVNAASAGTSNPDNNTTGIAIRNVQLLGTVSADGFMQHQYLLNLNAVSDVLVDNVLFKGWRGDAIYLGSGNVASIERHNQRIKITRNTFDGVNQDNRNAISVIDGDDVLIAGNTFRNTTRTDMPGAVDIEPNGAAYPVTRNIKIVDNDFTSIRGNTGVVGAWLTSTQATLTTDAVGFTVTGNTFRSCTNNSAFYFSQFQQPAASTAGNNVLFAGNTVLSTTGRPFEVSGVRGLKITGNLFDGPGSAAAIGYTYKVLDVAIDNNEFRTVGNSDGRVFQLYRGSQVFFRYNDTYGASGSFVRYDVDGGSTGASDDVHYIGNVVRGPGTTFTSKHASHTISGTNTARHNDLSAMSTTTIDTTHVTPPQLYASTTYDPGSLAAGAAANTTVTVTGAATGDTVVASHSSIDTAATSWIIYGYVSAANTVRVIIFNATGGTVDLASGTLRVRVFKQGFLN